MPNPVNETGKEAYSRAETVPLKRKAEGFIYFITDGEAVKIGFSNSAEHRRKALQIAHHKPLKIIAFSAADRKEEWWVHNHFSDLRISGEWFRPDPRIDELIAELKRYRAKIENRVITIRDVMDGKHYALLPKRWTPPVEIAAFKKWFAENAGVLFDGSAPEARRALMSINIMNQENYKYSRSIQAATQKCLREFQDFLSAA